MASKQSFESIVARLEAQVAFDREREAFHAEKEVFHREERARYAAELEKLTSILEAFKTAADTATELTNRASALPAPEPGQDIGRKPSLTRMITRILETKSPADVFGTAALTKEVNRQYKERLRRPVKAKLVSITLRRMLKQGQLRLVRKGKPHYEALYARAEG